MTAGGKNVAPGGARGPAARAPAGRRSASSSATRSRSSPRSSPSTRRCSRPGPRTTACRRSPSTRRGPTTTVLAELQKAVDDANTAVSKAESIRKFAVLPGDFTEENGYLTPSLKLKRNVVMKDFHDDVEALYAPAAAAS